MASTLEFCLLLSSRIGFGADLPSTQISLYCFTSQEPEIFLLVIIFLSRSSSAPRGPGSPNYRGFAITLRHTTRIRTNLYA
jgi:hypothetical protein